MADEIEASGSAFGTGELDRMSVQLDLLAEKQLQFNLALESSDRLGRQFGKTLTTAFVGLAAQGKSFGDVLSTLALSLSKLAVGAAFKPLESLFGSAVQSLVAAPTLIGGSGLASPSLFSFGSSGSSGDSFGSLLAGAGSGSPLSSAVGNNSNIVFNVTTPNVESFQSSETQIAALLARAVAKGQRNL